MQDELAAYRPIDGVVVPDVPVYVLLDVDTGAGTLNEQGRAAARLVLGGQPAHVAGRCVGGASIADAGDHGAIRDADPAVYDARVAAFFDGLSGGSIAR